MARLRKVWVWPSSGKANEPWDDSPEVDSFLKTSRRVSEAFRRELERENIRTRDSEIETMVVGVEGDDIAVEAVERGAVDGPENGSITVPFGFHRLDPYTRAFFVADALHAIAIRLGTVHSWDIGAIDRAMDAVRVHDYEFDWTSAWRPNQEATAQVRLHARLLDDGFGRVRLEFAPIEATTGAMTGSTTPNGTTDAAVPTLITEETVGGTTRGDFARMAQSMSWSGENVVTVRGLGRGFAASADNGLIRTLATPKNPLPNSAEPDPDRPLPRVRVDDPPPISFVMGCGPLEKVPKKYVNQLDELFAHLCNDPEWIEWWLALGVAEVELEYEFEGKTLKHRVVTTPDRIVCSIVRPRVSVARGADGRAMAYADVMVLLDRVRIETGQETHPPLPMSSEAS